jgi:hypothetical protein
MDPAAAHLGEAEGAGRGAVTAADAFVQVKRDFHFDFFRLVSSSIVIACQVQASMHWPQSIHSSLTRHFISSTHSAPTGHIRVHAPQPVHLNVSILTVMSFFFSTLTRFVSKVNNYVTLSTIEDGREGLVEWLSALNHQILTVASLPQNDF